MRKKGFTLIELLVVIAIIAMLMAILMPALSKVKKIAQRVVCGTNLKGLGTAQTVYANDYDDEYAVQGRGHSGYTWGWITNGFQNVGKEWDGTGGITVGASLYLLVREADVSPKSYVCPGSTQQEFSGENDNNLDIVQLWDFGLAGGSSTLPDEGPYKCVSYSYHQPYSATGGKSRYAASGSLSAAFAVMADKNPYYDPQLVGIGSTDETNWVDRVHAPAPYWSDDTISESDWRVKRANSQPHDRESQNVLFADGHAANEKVVDVGVKNDNIYVMRLDSSQDGIRQGDFSNMPADHDLSKQPQGSDDSFLVSDDSMTASPSD